MKGMFPQTPTSAGRSDRVFRFPFATQAGLGLGLPLLLTGCTGEQSMLDPKGPSAADIAVLWWWMFWGAALILALVMVLALYAVYRDPDKRLQIKASPMVFVGGVLLPVVALTPLIFFGLLAGYRALAIDEEALRVQVIGHQFWWEVRYPHPSGEGFVATANELRIPAGRPVMLELESRDVIHSFWVPNLAGKQDVLPGRTNRLRVEADEPGVSRGQCAEFCGALHAHMTFHVIAEDPADFEAWLQAQAAPAQSVGVAGGGLQAFIERGCVQCHSIRGTSAQGQGGPDLTHVASRYSLGSGVRTEPDAESLARWIVSKEHFKPGATMPVFHEQDQDVLQAIALYLESLK